MFHGFVSLGETLPCPALVKNSAGVPVNADTPPAYRVYGPDGLIDGQTGTSGVHEQGAITQATNAAPIVVTSAGHGLTTGSRVSITGVAGNTAANGTWVITRVDGDTFSLDGSSGNALYTGGGTWNVAGLYSVDLSCTANNGYEAGKSYYVLFSALVSGAAWGELHSFSVG
jgi:hypothetical protein